MRRRPGRGRRIPAARDECTDSRGHTEDDAVTGEELVAGAGQHETLAPLQRCAQDVRKREAEQHGPDERERQKDPQARPGGGRTDRPAAHGGEQVGGRQRVPEVD